MCRASNMTVSNNRTHNLHFTCLREWVIPDCTSPTVHQLEAPYSLSDPIICNLYFPFSQRDADYNEKEIMFTYSWDSVKKHIFST